MAEEEVVQEAGDGVVAAVEAEVARGGDHQAAAGEGYSSMVKK